MTNPVLIDEAAYNDSQLRIACAKAIIDTIGIFINESEEIPVSNSLIHSALMGATMLLDDASAGFCKKPAAI
jgi:hypothetical protein